MKNRTKQVLTVCVFFVCFFADIGLGIGVVHAKNELPTSKTNLASGDFVTKWDLSKRQKDEIAGPVSAVVFKIASTGAVNYIVEDDNGTIIKQDVINTVSGNVTIDDLPVDGRITLYLSSNNLNRFYFDAPNSNQGTTPARLVDVQQWGEAQWTSMENAFVKCENLDITATDKPDLSNVGNMKFAFYGCTNMTGPYNINEWNIENVNSLQGTFWGASKFNQPLADWNTKNVTSMQTLFYEALTFDQPIGNWDVTKVNSMLSMFYGATSFNQDIGDWKTGNVSFMKFMFKNAKAFNQDIGDWNTESVTEMQEMFDGALTFNQDIGRWNTRSVKKMQKMFHEAVAFNQDISGWNTAEVTDMSSMFKRAKAFNQPIGKWNISKVTNLSQMFMETNAFNQWLNDWNTGAVTTMSEMFRDAKVFNQSLSKWDVKKVTTMANMFNGASHFNKSLGRWTLAQSTLILTRLLDNSAVDCVNFSKTLIGWALNPVTAHGRTLNVPNRSYGTHAKIAYNLLETKGWIIQNATEEGSICRSVSEFVTKWDLSKTGGTVIGFNILAASNKQVEYSVVDEDDVELTWGTLKDNESILINDLPEGKTVTLKLESDHLKRFYFDVPQSAVSPSDPRNALIDVLQWGTAEWVSMQDAFRDASNLQLSATDIPDLSNVVDMSSMFEGCTSLVESAAMNSWNTSNIEKMVSMFKNATSFNQDIGTWNTAKVTAMSQMFSNAQAFNRNIGSWNTISLTDMYHMFLEAASFNQNIGSWSTALVTTMHGTFSKAKAFNQDIGDWDTGNVEDMHNMFYEAEAFNQDLKWNTAKVKDMGQMFSKAKVFNGRLDVAEGKWNTGSVTDMESMFFNASVFDQPIGDWDVSAVETMSGMFWNALKFNQDISSWVPGKVKDMRNMFNNAAMFNQNMPDWNTGSVENMSSMFRDAKAFAGNVENWSTANVKEMSGMFAGAIAFNGDLLWNTANVANMSGMFDKATVFNGTFGPEWNTSNVTSMENMFRYADAFNQNISLWNTEKVTRMVQMFWNAKAFDQDLGAWNLRNITSLGTMLNGSGLGCRNYSSTLIGWAANTSTPDGITFGALGLEYGTNAEDARDALLEKGWNIADKGPSGLYCGPPMPFNTKWDLSKTGGTAISFFVNIETGQEVVYRVVDENDAELESGVLDGQNKVEITGLPAGKVVTLKLGPDYLRRFYFDVPQSTVPASDPRNALVDVTNWGTVGWTSMQDAFRDASNLQVSATDIPDLSNVVDMSSMFEGCTSLDESAGMNDWNTSNIEKMASMFKKATSFNQNIGAWNTEKVTTMYAMFDGASVFNQDIGSWNTESLTNMRHMFLNAKVFNQDIGLWNTARVTEMYATFSGATAFNQDIGNWNTGNATDMYSMFKDAESFNQDLKWNTASVENMGQMFSGAKAFNGRLDVTGGKWNTGSVTNMERMFAKASAFDQAVGGWNVSAVETMNGMFLGASAFDQDISSWTPEKVKYMQNMFQDAVLFNQDMPDWNTGSVENMSSMFKNAKAFAGNIKKWSTANVTDMSGMFAGAIAFNGDLLWNTAKVKNMTEMFDGAESFNGTFGPDWKTDAVTSMRRMFRKAKAFNGEVSDWKVDEVTDMFEMFKDAELFNSDLSQWKTGKVTTMNYMFNAAKAFNQNLGGWNLKNVGTLESMLNGSGLDCFNYSKTLIGWAANPSTKTNLTLGASGLTYGTNAQVARDVLTGSKGWTINGDIAGTDACIPADLFITEWDLSKTGSPAVGGTTKLNFTIGSDGPVNYSWTSTDGLSSGNGTINSPDQPDFYLEGLPANKTITLELESENLKQFYFVMNVDSERLMDVKQWGRSVWRSMGLAFINSSNLNITAKDIPDLSQVKDLTSVFEGCTSLTGPDNIGEWDTKNVTSMYRTFKGASSFNQDISGWNTGNVTRMDQMFEGATAFNQAIGEWVTDQVVDMSYMFNGATVFNQDISGWNTGNVTKMNWMFNGATAFNQAIGEWATAQVTDMSYMFSGASSFNQDIRKWNTGAVTNMEYMFSNAPLFDQDIGNWETGKVTEMGSMFWEATAFNQDIGNWNVTAVRSMKGMFHLASAFNQNLGNWTIGVDANLDMFYYTGMQCDNYSSTLIGWAANVNTPDDIYLGAEDLKYGTNAQESRDILEAKGWRINGDIAGPGYCGPQLPQTINPITDIVKIYGDAAFSPGATATSGLAVTYVSDDNTTVEYNSTTGLIEIKKVGVVTVTAKQAGNEMYLPAADVTFQFTITKAPLMVTADAKSKVYGTQPDPVLTYVVKASDLKNGDAASVVTGDLLRDMGEDVGIYAIRQGTLDAVNYTVSYVGADFEITKAPLTVTADAKSKVYGTQSDPVLTYVVKASDLKNGDAASVVTGDLLRDMGEDVGIYAIRQGTLDAVNYTVSYVGADFEITKAPLTVTADAKSKVYGTQPDPVLTYVVKASDLKNGDAASVVTGDLLRDAGEDVGIYAIKQGTLMTTNNYTLNYLEADFTITEKLITITPDAQSKVYNTADPTLSYVVTDADGTVLNLSATMTGALSRDAGENVGTYNILQGTLSAGANYAMTFVTGKKFTITPAAVTVTPDAQSKVYNTADPTLSYVVTDADGTVLNLSAAMTGALNRDAGENVGAYNILQGTLSAGANYTITFVAGKKLTITKAVLSGIIFESKEFVYDGNVKRLELKGNIPGGAEVRYSNNDQVNAGTYQVKAEIAGTANYEGAIYDAVMTIHKAKQTIIFKAPSEVALEEEAIPLDVYATSGLEVTLTVNDPLIATVTGTTLKPVAEGTVQVTATQPGDNNHEAATPVIVSIKVVKRDVPLKVRPHKAVSPNYDGINEFFKLDGIEYYPENKVTIFDKNGVIMAEIVGYNNQDKRYTGEWHRDGTYYYYLDVKENGVWRREKGYFVVRR